MKLVNFGCGNQFHKSWLNFDISPSAMDVKRLDISKPLPFEDNSVDAVYHSHLLEHLSRPAAQAFTSECYRILKPAGHFRAALPDLEVSASNYLTATNLAREMDSAAQERYEWAVIELIDQLNRNNSGGEMAAYWSHSPMPAQEFVRSRVGQELDNARAPLPRPNKGVLQRFYDCLIGLVLKQSDLEALRVGRFRLSGEVHLWMYDRYSASCLLANSGFRQIACTRADRSRIPDFSQYLLDQTVDGKQRKPDSFYIEATKD